MKPNWLFLSLIGLTLLLLFGCNERPSTTIQVTRVVTREVAVTRIIPGGGEVQMCTLLGCQDELTVELDVDLPETFSIDIVYEAGGESVQVTRWCENGRWITDDQPCVEFQLEAAPDEVAVTAHWGENKISQVYNPDYDPFRPNGPACEPVCWMGTITFSFRNKRRDP